MITEMTKYSWILLNGDRDSFLEQLRELGVVDVTRSTRAIDDKSEALLARIGGLKDRIRCIEKGMDPKLAALSAACDGIARELAELTPWGEYDREKLNSLGIPVHYFRIPAKKYDKAWEEDNAIQTISRNGDTVWFVALGDCSIPEKELAAPQCSLARKRQELEDARAAVDSYRKELEASKDDIPGLKEEISSLTGELNLYLADQAATAAAEDHLAVFEGFAPTENDTELQAAFDNMPVVWLADAAKVDDNPPIKFKNNRFVKMFEPLTDMYGRPSYDGFDPTPYIAIFFLLFFAMCMGDLGYGIILVIVGLLLGKVESFKKFAPLVVTLGVGTIIIGFFFHTFFSIDFSQWACIPDGLKKIMVPAQVAGYDGTMVLALVVGIVHLCLAMIVKTVYATKNQGFLNSLSTWGWTLLIVGAVVVGLIALIGVIDKAAVKTILIVLGIVCALGIFPFNNMKRNVLSNVGSGLWDTYNMATGILGDVLSYLRLYALGLAGAMLGFAFNDLAKMALGDGGVRWIFFILIVIIGHTLNLAMAALGAFVHPLRLNFLEFFKNSGYEGSGKKYNPLTKE